jgi:hypothetical protein
MCQMSLERERELYHETNDVQNGGPERGPVIGVASPCGQDQALMERLDWHGMHMFLRKAIVSWHTPVVYSLGALGKRGSF